VLISTTLRCKEPDHHPADDDASAHRSRGARELGISDGLVRLSCGLEHPDDVVKTARRARIRFSALIHRRAAASPPGP